SNQASAAETLACELHEDAGDLLPAGGRRRPFHQPKADFEVVTPLVIPGEVHVGLANLEVPSLLPGRTRGRRGLGIKRVGLSQESDRLVVRKCPESLCAGEFE